MSVYTGVPDLDHRNLTKLDRLVGHLSRDSTAIEAREKPVTSDKAPPLPKRKRGRPKKGEKRPKAPKRLDLQATMSLPEMLDDLPTDCAVGTKKNSKGYKSTWAGYNLHIDVADGQIPVGCILTSASLHDSQAAIPLATMSRHRSQPGSGFFLEPYGALRGSLPVSTTLLRRCLVFRMRRPGSSAGVFVIPEPWTSRRAPERAAAPFARSWAARRVLPRNFPASVSPAG